MLNKASSIRRENRSVQEFSSSSFSSSSSSLSFFPLSSLSLALCLLSSSFHYARHCALISHDYTDIDDSPIAERMNGQAFLSILDDEEKILKTKSDSYANLLQTDGGRLTEEIRSDISAVIGEAKLLLTGKLKQFRGLCQANVAHAKAPTGEPIPLDSDLEGFWDMTYPLIDKVKEKFGKLDTRQAKQWAPIEEFDPNDMSHRLKQLQPQQNKVSKIPLSKAANDDLKKLIQERRRAAANTANQNDEVEIFVGPK